MTWAVCYPDGRVVRLDNSDSAPEGGVLLAQTYTTWPTPPTPEARLYLVDGALVWRDARTLAERKADKRALMMRAWETARGAGVLIGGKTAPTDAAAWTRYVTLKLVLLDGDWIDTPIPLVDGSYELLTQAKFTALWQALKAFESGLLIRLRDRIDEISAATTPEQVAAVTW